MNRYRLVCISSLALALLVCPSAVHAGLLGYWSGDSTAGAGTSLPNDQGNAALEGVLMGAASYTGDAGGHTGQPGDYALDLPGTDPDYVSLPATGASLSSATITAWVKGSPTNDWAGIVQSRDAAQPIGIGYSGGGGAGRLGYTWNDNNASSWAFARDAAEAAVLGIPVDEWTFVAATITPTDATLYVGPQGGTLQSAVNAIPHAMQVNTTEWRLGEDNCCGNARDFAGLIDDVSIWDVALTANQISALHSGAATPLTVPEPSSIVGALIAAALLLGRRRNVVG